MTTATDATDSGPVSHEVRSVRSPLNRRLVAWVLLAGWLVVAVAAVATGERESSLDSLRDAIAEGDVDEVRVEGGLGPRSRGFSTVKLTWSEHGLDYFTEVTQARGRPSRGETWRSDDRPRRVAGDLAGFLDLGDDDVRLVRTRDYGSGIHAELVGWRLTGWVVWLMAGLFVMTSGMLGGAGEPWRATRRAWFWLILMLPPFVCPAYLLFGGPAGLARPKRPEARLTGGWAFLLAILLGGIGIA